MSSLDGSILFWLIKLIYCLSNMTILEKKFDRLYCLIMSRDMAIL